MRMNADAGVPLPGAARVVTDVSSHLAERFTFRPGVHGIARHLWSGSAAPR
jgi:hypothetical protein